MTGVVAVWLKIDPGRVSEGLQEALAHLDSADGELLLDFSAVSRLNPEALIALHQLANAAEAKGARVVLRGANVDVYTVIKLARLAPRFRFVS